ncbi:ATP/GTP-binding protein [Cystobacter fuscus DSM 2262]|uniref:ATP/GTP-binding protein n=2 Tax=Cystobacter fuscus TaxID=43 RepID=S9P5B3_CYSF2|nr:ATP/GTP-binding protein [Cystobacter fuscus DSM 2262]
MGNHQLKAFEICGLHGDRDVRLETNSPVKILVDKNGSGKTTVLSTLFHMLTGRLNRLRRLNFSEISIEFDTGEKIKIESSLFGRPPQDLMEDRDQRTNRYQMLAIQIFDFLGERDFESLVNLLRRYPEGAAARNSKIMRASALLGASPKEIMVSIESFGREILRQNTARHTVSPLQELHNIYPYPVLYFPTYRRIEEDLHTLGYSEPDLPRDEQLIQFGMSDVQQRLEKITTQIRDSSIEWYSKINGRILTELIDGIQVTEEMRSSLQDAEALRIVLDRVGENIDEQHKKHILELIRTGRIQGDQYSPLVYFLSNLGKVYEQQRDKDNMIKDFVRVANSYLDDKEVVYNESKLQINIIHKKTGRRVDVERLSSGEKQIVSIFSRLYLSPHREYVILFDEPELSLSIEWQKRLLEDIVASHRCKLLIAATHSPFIFENSLDQYAGELTVTASEITENAKVDPEESTSSIEDGDE